MVEDREVKDPSPETAQEDKELRTREDVETEAVKETTKTFFTEESRFSEKAAPMNEDACKEVRGVLDRRREEEYVQEAKSFLESNQNVSSEVLEKMPNGEIFDLVRNNEEFRKRIEKSERVKRLSVLSKNLERVEGAGGKTSYGERISFFNEAVPEKKNEFDKMWESEDDRKTAEKLWELTTGKKLNEEAEERMGGPKDPEESYLREEKEKIFKISNKELKEEDKKREADEDWKRLTAKEKKQKLIGERSEKFRKKMEAAGLDASEKDMVALHREYPEAFSDDATLEKNKDGGFVIRTGKEKPSLIKRVFGGKKGESVEIDKVNLSHGLGKIDGEIHTRRTERESQKEGKKKEIIWETRQKEGKELAEAAYQSIIDGMANERIKDFESENVLSREKKREYEGGKGQAEMLDFMIENLSETEDFIKNLRKALEILKKAGFDISEEEVLGSEAEKGEEGEKEKDEKKKKFKEALKRESFALGFLIAFLMYKLVEFTIQQMDKASGGKKKESKKQ